MVKYTSGALKDAQHMDIGAQFVAKKIILKKSVFTNGRGSKSPKTNLEINGWKVSTSILTRLLNVMLLVAKGSQRLKVTKQLNLKKYVAKIVKSCQSFGKTLFVRARMSKISEQS